LHFFDRQGEDARRYPRLDHANATPGRVIDRQGGYHLARLSCGPAAISCSYILSVKAYLGSNHRRLEPGRPRLQDKVAWQGGDAADGLAVRREEPQRHDLGVRLQNRAEHFLAARRIVHTLCEQGGERFEKYADFVQRAALSGEQGLPPRRCRTFIEGTD